MISAGEFRNGVTFEQDGQVLQVVEFQHVKPGKGAAFVRTKTKNVITGSVVETSYNPTAKFPQAFIERKDVTYSYADGDLYHFMDNETYDDIPVNALPLSRYYAANRNVLPSPFKVIQTDRVFRAERPQKGRLREFVQCDIDILGDESPNAEVELIDVTARALLKIGFDGFTVNINDRRILRGMLESMGFAPETLDSVCITFDKMDKVGAEGVRAELTEKGLPAGAIDQLAAFLAQGEVTLDAVAARCADPAIASDLKYVLETAGRLAEGKYKVAYCPSLVRGQGYYTGMVFEVVCPQFAGAVAGGGRYDNMVGKFLGQQVPAVGFSIGFERVCGILLEQGYQIPGAKQKIALLYPAGADFPAVLAQAETLRADYGVTVLAQGKKLGKQLAALETAGFAGAAFAGKDEIKWFAERK